MAPETDWMLWFWVGSAATTVSVIIASVIGQSRRSWAWGLLGPIGWILAVQFRVLRRVDEIGADRGRHAKRP